MNNLTSAAIAAFVAFLVTWSARAQHVVASDERGVVLSLGSAGGVRKGMTGKLCTPELVAGRIVENCSARFVVVSTSTSRSIVQITKGVGRDIKTGYLAKFDQKLVPKTPPPVRDREQEREREERDATDRALRRADQAFESDDCRGAVERYESFLEAYPKHPKADVAASRIQQCRTQLDSIGLGAPAGDVPAASDLPAPPPAPAPQAVASPPAFAVEAEELAVKAERLLQEGDLKQARSAATQALKTDSTNPRAHAIIKTIYGKAIHSRFNRPTDITVTTNGWCYVVDTGNNTIRKIANDQTTTVAGAAGQFGKTDGPGEHARFNEPTGAAVARDGTIYVADRYNATVRRIAPGGLVTTAAGRNGSVGRTDGDSATARFEAPRRLAIDSQGTIYVADTGNHAIRKISPAGNVTTLFTASGGDRMDPVGLAIDPTGGVLVADVWGHVIRRVDPDGTMRIVAGIHGSSGSADGLVTAARFNAPEGIAVGNDGAVYVTDSGNHTIRKIANGIVSTIAGRTAVSGVSDGVAAMARFNHPAAVSCDALGRLWIADTGNNTIRMLADGFVSTVAGLPLEAGSSDGPN